MKSKAVLFLVASALTMPVYASVPTDTVASTLKSKPAQRMAMLKRKGVQGLRELRQVAFDQSQTLENRWKALMTLAVVGKRESLPELHRAAVAGDWFMRDGAIKAMRKVAPDEARIWARRLMNDPAMVVRSTAAQTLGALGDTESRGLLWQKLYSAENFRGSQSLWVRKDIAVALNRMANKGDEAKFLKVLKDQDQTLHIPATAALRKLTGLKPSVKDKTLKSEVGFWKTWGSTKSF